MSQTSALMQKKLNAIFVRLCLIRDLSQMCPCVVPLPAVVVRVYMPCVSLTLAGSCWGYSCDAVMCAELGRYSTFPFGRRWPSTLKARDCLSSPARSSQCKRTDIDRETHISQSICFTFCVWVCVRAGPISSLKSRTHFYFLFLQALL